MKRRKLVGLVMVGLVRVIVATAAAAQEASARPAIAIADVAVSQGGWTLPPPQISATIVELMTSELVTSQRFHVYDGQWLVPESEVGHPNLERLRAAAAERHVDYVVLGTLTAFSNEQQHRKIGGFFPKPFIAGGLSKNKSVLHVGLTLRIVDVRTGEIYSSVNGDGIGIRHSSGLGALGVVHGLPVGALVSAARASHSRDAMLDEAVRNAVHQAALALSQATLPTSR